MTILKFPNAPLLKTDEQVRSIISCSKKDAVGIIFLSRKLEAIAFVERNPWLTEPSAHVVWITEQICETFHITRTPTILFYYRGSVCFRRYEYLQESKFRNLLLMSEVRPVFPHSSEQGDSDETP